jgi:LacI family transcriptional regulator
MSTPLGRSAASRRAPRPTMKDVAEAAGVGLGTVSRVLSKRGQVSEPARLRVEAAAARLNYRPSALARGLKSQRTDNIGLIVADISNNFYGEFAEGVLAAAKDMGKHVIVCASGESPDSESEYIELLIEQRVDGIVAFPTGGNIPTWQLAREMGITVVFADRTVAGLDFPSVIVDNAEGSRRLTEYLLALGHRRIGYLGGPVELTSGLHREEGFYQAHLSMDVRVEPELVVRGRFTRDTAYASALRLLDVVPPPTALVAANNVLGEAALGAIKQLGLRVPDDISVVMFDDVPWASLVDPGITVIAQPATRMGRACARMIVTPGTEVEQRLVLETEMIKRGSAVPYHGLGTPASPRAHPRRS